MAQSIKVLVNKFMGTRDGVLPSIQAFPPLDDEQIARELRLDERASVAGQTDQPPADAARPDLIELEISAEIERRARKATEDYFSQRDLYEGRIRRAVISSDQRVSIEAAAKNALADFNAAIVDDWNHLHTLSQEVEGRAEEFRAFQKRHKLARLPKTAHENETLRWMLLVLFVLLESILNGMFFAEGSEAGLIGGVVQAFILSLLNVGSSTLYGWFFLPLLFHRRIIIKGLGTLFTIAFVLWLVGLNLAIGHFRDLFIRGAGNVPWAELLNQLSAAPLLLEDAKSGLLVLWGIGLGLATIIDVGGMRDPYPGFAAAGRERNNAIERYAEEKSRCLANITDLRNRAVEDMTSAIERICSSQYDMQLAIDGRSRLHSNYVAFLEHLAAVQERLIHRYREANRKVRTATVPAYFRNPVVRAGFLERPTLSSLPEIEQDARTAVLSRIENHIKTLNEKFDRTMHEYQTVGQLTTKG